jgi:hypothetical protein
MIIFFAEGRLGNQIFQYAFLKKIQQHNEKIIVFEFHELKNVFEKIEVINVRCRYKIKNYILKPVLCFFCRINLISSISVITENIIIMTQTFVRVTQGGGL